MSRLSIELSTEEHQRLKVAAALRGKTIKEYVLERVFASGNGSDSDLAVLEDFLQPRVAEAKKGQYVSKSVTDIFTEARDDLE